jgi:hypothetical protein
MTSDRPSLRSFWADLPVEDNTPLTKAEAKALGVKVFDLRRPPRRSCFRCHHWAMGYDPHFGLCGHPVRVGLTPGMEARQMQMVDGCALASPMALSAVARREAAWHRALRQAESDAGVHDAPPSQGV